MFLKRLERRQNGKGHTYWALVESYRTTPGLPASRGRVPGRTEEERAERLWKTLAQWMRGAGLGDAPRTLVEQLAQIQNGDVLLAARMAEGTQQTLRLRCVTTPDEPQKVLRNRFGVTLPQRLRGVEEVESLPGTEPQM